MSHFKINSNMRCIEIRDAGMGTGLVSGINSNMRCIEIHKNIY